LFGDEYTAVSSNVNRAARAYLIILDCRDDAIDDVARVENGQYARETRLHAVEHAGVDVVRTHAQGRDSRVALLLELGANRLVEAHGAPFRSAVVREARHAARGGRRRDRDELAYNSQQSSCGAQSMEREPLGIDGRRGTCAGCIGWMDSCIPELAAIIGGRNFLASHMCAIVLTAIVRCTIDTESISVAFGERASCYNNGLARTSIAASSHCRNGLPDTIPALFTRMSTRPIYSSHTPRVAYVAVRRSGKRERERTRENERVRLGWIGSAYIAHDLVGKLVDALLLAEIALKQMHSSVGMCCDDKLAGLEATPARQRRSVSGGNSRASTVAQPTHLLNERHADITRDHDRTGQRESRAHQPPDTATATGNDHDLVLEIGRHLRDVARSLSLSLARGRESERNGREEAAEKRRKSP